MSYKEIYQEIEKMFEQMGVEKNENLIVMIADYTAKKIIAEKEALIDDFIARLEGAGNNEEERHKG